MDMTRVIWGQSTIISGGPSSAPAESFSVVRHPNLGSSPNIVGSDPGSFWSSNIRNNCSLTPVLICLGLV